jgi:hypothetical protein
MRLVIIWLLLLVAWSCLPVGMAFPVWGMGGPAPQKGAPPAKTTMMAEKVFLIDDFESGSLRSPREWWTFDIQKAEVVPAKNLNTGDPNIVLAVGNYSLLLQGPAKNWYAGGCGTYLAKEKQDLSKYNSYQIDIFGNGPGSGTLKIELYDDDNGNWQLEQDAKNNYLPIYDDKWVYDIRVDWAGWKRLTVPLSDFVDDNPGVGDDIWNPQQNGASGGLLQTQFVCLGSSDKGRVNFDLDNVALTIVE